MINCIMPILCAIVSTISPSCVEDYLSSNQYIKDAACYIEKDIAIVAALTKPIFTKSERERLARDIAEDLAKRFDLDRIIVTFDSEVFCHIELATASIDKLERLAKTRGGSYEYIRDNRQKT